MTTEEKVRRFENATSCAKSFNWKPFILFLIVCVLVGIGRIMKEIEIDEWAKKVAHMSVQEKEVLAAPDDEDSYPYDEPDPIHN